jgi:hypothetical protein
MFGGGSGHQKTGPDALANIAPKADRPAVGIDDYLGPHGAGHPHRAAPVMGKSYLFQRWKKLCGQLDSSLLFSGL